MKSILNRKIFLIIARIGLIITASIISFIVAGYILSYSGYKQKPHNWIFQNEEFIQESTYQNFSTIDKNEIFKPRKNTTIAPDYWETDDLGFRLNPQHKNNKATYKIVVLGDSFAYGHGVDHLEAWPAVLERLYNQSGQSVIVHNAGVPASTTDQQYVRFERLIDEIRPNKIFWMVNLNDIIESNYSCLYKKIGKSHYYKIPAFLNIAYINAFLTKYIPKNLILTNIGNLLTTITIKGFDLYTIGCTEVVSNEQIISNFFSKFEYLVLQAKEKAIKRNIGLIFLLAPAQIYFDHSYNNDDLGIRNLNRLKEILSKIGVMYIDLNEKIAINKDPVLFSLRNPTIDLAWQFQHNVLGASIEKERMNKGLNFELFLDERNNFEYGEWHLNGEGNRIVAEIVFNSIHN